jgi:hypothetical protein
MSPYGGYFDEVVDELTETGMSGRGSLVAERIWSLSCPGDEPIFSGATDGGACRGTQASAR